MCKTNGEVYWQCLFVCFLLTECKMVPPYRQTPPKNRVMLKSPHTRRRGSGGGSPRSSGYGRGRIGAYIFKNVLCYSLSDVKPCHVRCFKKFSVWFPLLMQIKLCFLHCKTVYRASFSILGWKKLSHFVNFQRNTSVHLI